MDYNDPHFLIEHLKKGEEKAYLFLVGNYHKGLHAYAISLVGDHAMAQDVVQNVFLSTWQFRNRLNPDQSIKSFLYKSVYNEFLNTYQKNKSMMLLQERYIASLDSIVELTDESTMNELIRIIHMEIDRLPPKCKKVFMLSKKEGLTNVEISEYLNISLKTVEAQITKAFGILKMKLQGKFEHFLFLIFSGRLVPTQSTDRNGYGSLFKRMGHHDYFNQCT